MPLIHGVVQVGVQQQRGVHVVTQRVVWLTMLVVPVVDRVGHLMGQPLGLPGPLCGQRPRHGLQQQAEEQEPGGEGGFHSGGFYRRDQKFRLPARTMSSVQAPTYCMLERRTAWAVRLPPLLTSTRVSLVSALSVIWRFWLMLTVSPSSGA